MIIRKKFRFEGAHVVRNCSSDRCKRSIHGHSYIVEVMLEADSLDNAHMVYDFGLFKGTIKDLVDSFDHAYSMWDKEKGQFQSFMKQHSARFIEMPISPSAEGYALMFAFIIDKILKNTEFNNGEGAVKVHAIRVHETETGYAQANMEDVEKMWNFKLTDIMFSEQIMKEWKSSRMWYDLVNNIPFINPKIIRTHG